MARTDKAVISRALNKPVVVEEVVFDPPKRGEVLLKLGACGVCHSDLSATNDTLMLPPPLILGHEAAGDLVIPSFIYMCGKCRFCTGGRLVLCVDQGKAFVTTSEGTPRVKDKAGQPLNIFSGCGVMAEYAVMDASSLVKIDPSIPPASAALVHGGFSQPRGRCAGRPADRQRGEFDGGRCRQAEDGRAGRDAGRLERRSRLVPAGSAH